MLLDILNIVFSILFALPFILAPVLIIKTAILELKLDNNQIKKKPDEFHFSQHKNNYKETNNE